MISLLEWIHHLFNKAPRPDFLLFFSLSLPARLSRYHVPLCPYIPVETKQNLNKSYAAAGSKLSRHGTVDYWENSSRDQLGLVDTTVDQKEAVFFRDSF